MEHRFVSFDLLIDRVGDSYRARILRSDFGEAHHDFDLPAIDQEAPAHEVARSSRDLRRRLGKEKIDPREFGRRLFEAVFQGEVGSIFRRCRDQTRSRDQILRLRLRLDSVPELAALPWETLYDPREGEFLAIEERISIVRYLEIASPVSELDFQAPLQVLAVVSSPVRLPKLNVEQEWQQIEASFSDVVATGEAVVDQLRPGTLEALLERLENEPCHVLHFVGHGAFDQRQQTGELMLESEDGGMQALDAHRLATALRRNPALRLVVLNVCESAKEAAADPFSGLAQTLLRHGVPAVVAMQRPIGDRAAVAFAQRFYESLAAGRSIDEAVTAAREKLYLHFQDSAPAWTLPVLFLRSAGSAAGLAQTDAASKDEHAGTPQPLVSTRRNASIPFWRRPAGLLLLFALATGIFALSLLQPRSDPRCPLPNGLEMEFVYLPGGSFEMGTADGVQDELSPRPVSVEPFCIAKYEVTQADWQALMEEDPPNTQYLDPRRPVNVSWKEAQRFIEALNSSNAGDGYRLPTEAQWEYAARAGGRGAYGFGDDEGELERYGNCRSVSGEDGYDGPAPVGSFKPNGFGLYDMHGNFREWVEDEGVVDEQLAAPVADLQSEDDDALFIEKRILRGGSFDQSPRNCRSASRSRLKGTRQHDAGFRVVYVFAEEETR